MSDFKLKLEEITAGVISQEIRHGIEIVQKQLKSDVLEFGRFIHIQHRNEWNSDIKNRWAEVFPQLPVAIDVKVDIESSTLYQKPMDIEKIKGSNILITGASGMIGSFLVDTLMRLNDLSNYNIRVFAMGRNNITLEKRFKSYIKNKNFITIQHDVKMSLFDKINLLLCLLIKFYFYSITTTTYRGRIGFSTQYIVVFFCIRTIVR
jgi:hypothetical protein